MNLFSKKIELSLHEKLAEFKKVFVEAHNGAISLAKEIEEELKANVEALQEAITNKANTEALQKQNIEFINNISKLI